MDFVTDLISCYKSVMIFFPLESVLAVCVFLGIHACYLGYLICWNKCSQYSLIIISISVSSVIMSPFSVGFGHLSFIFLVSLANLYSFYGYFQRNTFWFLNSLIYFLFSILFTYTLMLIISFLLLALGIILSSYSSSWASRTAQQMQLSQMQSGFRISSVQSAFPTWACWTAPGLSLGGTGN